MGQGQDRDQLIRKLLNARQFATLDELKVAASTESTMTVRRCLARLDYLTSYSHRGQFYTLPTIPDFDTWGLWSAQSAMFSRYGNLLQTGACLVDQADAGFTATELEALVQVEVKHSLLHLQRQGRIARVKIAGRFVYVCADPGERRRQELMRGQNDAQAELGCGLTDLLPDELRAGIVLFYSLLDEKQRRLYAGLEAAKLGHGGDRQMAELLNLNSHTVAKGRRELFGGAVDRSGVRSKGGGRKLIEKKRQK